MPCLPNKFRRTISTYPESFLNGFKSQFQILGLLFVEALQSEGIHGLSNLLMRYVTVVKQDQARDDQLYVVPGAP